MDLSILFTLIDGTAGSSQAFGTGRHRLWASDFFRHYVSGKAPGLYRPHSLHLNCKLFAGLSRGLPHLAQVLEEAPFYIPRMRWTILFQINTHFQVIFSPFTYGMEIDDGLRLVLLIPLSFSMFCVSAPIMLLSTLEHWPKMR